MLDLEHNFEFQGQRHAVAVGPNVLAELIEALSLGERSIPFRWLRDRICTQLEEQLGAWFKRFNPPLGVAVEVPAVEFSDWSPPCLWRIKVLGDLKPEHDGSRYVWQVVEGMVEGMPAKPSVSAGEKTGHFPGKRPNEEKVISREPKKRADQDDAKLLSFFDKEGNQQYLSLKKSELRQKIFELLLSGCNIELMDVWSERTKPAVDIRV